MLVVLRTHSLRDLLRCRKCTQTASGGTELGRRATPFSISAIFHPIFHSRRIEPAVNRGEISNALQQYRYAGDARMFLEYQDPRNCSMSSHLSSV
jgi:hypothetical protein